MSLTSHAAKLEALLRSRILLLDGAMGTMIQRARLAEEDYRGARFRDWQRELRGHNDLLSLTQPRLIRDIHAQYLQAGADIIETNTFNSTSVALADYGMERLARELNRAAAELAVDAAREWHAKTPQQPRFVAGVLGPTNKTASISPDVNDPGFRAITFDALVAAYTEAIEGLLEGSVDLLLVETVFDTLNAKAALFAIEETFERRASRLPVIISGTITDASGRTLSGQTTEAFYNSVRHTRPLAVGLNCALGAKELRPYVEELAKLAESFTSCHPNAGLPNAFGEYEDTPESMARQLGEWARSGWINIAGGCCGTTPEHIAAIAQSLHGVAPRQPAVRPRDRPGHDLAELARLRVRVAPLHRHEHMHAVGAARLREGDEPERVEGLLDEERDLHDLADADVRGRIEVEEDEVGPVGPVDARVPRVHVDAAHVDHPEKRVLVVHERRVDPALLRRPLARRDLDVEARDPLRHVRRRVLLEERLAVRPVWIPAHRERPVLEVWDEKATDFAVVVDQVALRDPQVGPEELVEVGKLHLALLDLGRPLSPHVHRRLVVAQPLEGRRP